MEAAAAAREAQPSSPSPSTPQGEQPIPAQAEIQPIAPAASPSPSPSPSASPPERRPHKKQRVHTKPQQEGAAAAACSNAATAAASASPVASIPVIPDATPLFVCIIGGGLAGLSCALSLQRVGIRCRVYERDASVQERRQGFGLTLTNSPVGALAQLGVLDACLKQDCTSTCHYVFDKDGNVLGYYGREFMQPEVRNNAKQNKREADEALAGNEGKDQADGSGTITVPVAVPQVAGASAAAPMMIAPASSVAPLPLPSPSPLPSPAPSPSPSPSAPLARFSSANLRIPRQDLRALLLERLLPDTVVWGARIKDFTEDATGVTVEFLNRASVRADVLVGADGIHSAVRRMQDEKAKEKTGFLKFLGVGAIIGLSDAQHPLIQARGFYTMGDRHRLFTMPFREAVTAADGVTVLNPSLTMWQLSFAEADESKAGALHGQGGLPLLQEALRRTAGWMEPVRALLEATPPEHVWGTALYDRDARRLRDRKQASRVTVVGDACHPMSMFKGQGANQSLQDGPLLAKMLTVIDSNTPASAVDSAGRPVLTAESLLNRVRRFEAQMVQRSSSRVLASRKAAEQLHTPQAALPSDQYGIGGVALSSDQLRLVLATCRERGVGARLRERLDEAFGALLDETVPPEQRDANAKPPRAEEM